MKTINEIIQQSALGPFSNMYKRIFLSLFSMIVFTLLGMLILLIHHGPNLSIKFGY